MPNRMLGKLPPVHRPGALFLAAYLPTKHVPIPETVTNSACVTDWGMMANDRLGDCTCAAAGHLIQNWTANNRCEAVLADAVVVDAYSAITGYTPSDPNSDQGAVETDVLAYWKTEGFGGHKLTDYAVIESRSEYQMKLAIWLFGGVYTGIALPLSAQDQDGWAVVPGPDGEPGSWGGHAVPILDYDAHRYSCVTWGTMLDMTKGFWRRYGDEAYAPLSLDWIDQVSNEAPNHLKWDDLKADLGRHFRHP